MDDNFLSKLLTGIFGRTERVTEQTPTGYRAYTKQVEPNLIQRIQELLTPKAEAIPPPPGRSEFPNPPSRLAEYMTPKIPGLGEQPKMEFYQPTPTPPPDPGAEPYMDIIRSAARERGIPEEIFYRVLARESMRFNPDVISGRLDSPVGARGIAQFMPDTANWWAGVHGDFDPLVPEQAIPASAHYLQYLHNQFDNDWRKTLAAYNWGEGNVRNRGIDVLPKETEDYLNAILDGLPY